MFNSIELVYYILTHGKAKATFDDFSSQINDSFTYLGYDVLISYYYLNFFIFTIYFQFFFYNHVSQIKITLSLN